MAELRPEKNQLGRLCLCLGVGVLWRFYADYRDRETPGRTHRLIAHCVVLAIALHLFQIMDSMTSLGSFLTASTVLTAANIRAVLRKPVLLHAVVICLLVVSSSLVFLSSSPALLAAFGRNPTLTDRTELWDQVLDLDNSSLFGTGYDSFWLGSRLETLWALNPWRPNEAHNGYLEIFLNLGWIGIALLGVVIVRGYRTCVQAWLAGESTGSLRLAFCFAGLIYNFTEAGFFRTQTGSWLFLLLAIMSLPPKLPASGAGNAERFRQRAQPSPLNQRSLKEATA